MAKIKNLPATKTSLYEYVAQHNMEGVNAVLNKYGVPSQTSIPNATYCLKTICANKGDVALKDVADIHPDKYLIQETIGGTLYSNCGGCSGADGNYSNCSGSCKCGKSSFTGERDGASEWYYQNANSDKKPVSTENNTLGMVMMFSVLALTFAIIYKNK